MISNTTGPSFEESKISTPPIVKHSSTERAAYSAIFEYNSFLGESINETNLKFSWKQLLDLKSLD